MAKKQSKLYRVNIDMTWSNDYVVKAKTKGEAKKKAWAHFKKSPPRKCFGIDVDEE